MNLVVDVGNTETVLGLFEPGRLEISTSWRYSTAVPRTPDELRLLFGALLRDAGFDPAGVRRSVIGSVVPAHTWILFESLGRLTHAPVLVVDGVSALPIRLDVEEPRTVGADRIVNTLAAVHLYGRDTVVVDLGTATTYDCISGDGVFLGGVIAPGVQAGQEWLSGRTAKLPRVDLSAPERVIGRRTESCLQSGIYYSIVDAVDGIVDRIRAEWERPDALVVATGGYAPLLATHSRTVEHVEPHLTLVGLELAGNHIAEGVAKTRRAALD
jgi:type III pantothenate kinase